MGTEHGIQEDFPEEGLLILTSENRWRPDESAGRRMAMCARTWDGCPVPVLNPHQTL